MTGIERLRRLAGSQDMGNAWTAMLANELNDIADQIEREQDASVADSPYDAILPEDREALRWVRDHGGLEMVKSLIETNVWAHSLAIIAHDALFGEDASADIRNIVRRARALAERSE